MFGLLLACTRPEPRLSLAYIWPSSLLAKSKQLFGWYQPQDSNAINSRVVFGGHVAVFDAWHIWILLFLAHTCFYVKLLFCFTSQQLYCCRLWLIHKLLIFLLFLYLEGKIICLFLHFIYMAFIKDESRYESTENFQNVIFILFFFFLQIVCLYYSWVYFHVIQIVTPVIIFFLL